eukprot:g71197.t1
MDEEAEKTAAESAEGEEFKRKGKGLMGRRRKKQEDKKTEGGEGGEGSAGAAFLRIQRDLEDLDLPENVTIKYPVKGDLMNFSLVIKITYEESLWKGGLYEFKFSIPSKYPFEGPKVVCIDKVYHPNIDLEGKICVSVLRPWKPTYSVQIVLFGLLFLFSHPNPNDPLNIEAAKVMRENPEQFTRNVRSSMRGALGPTLLQHIVARAWLIAVQAAQQTSTGLGQTCRHDSLAHAGLAAACNTSPVETHIPLCHTPHPQDHGAKHIQNIPFYMFSY